MHSSTIASLGKTSASLTRRTVGALARSVVCLLPVLGAQAQAQSKSMANLNFQPDIPYTQAATENGPMTLALDFFAPKGACTAPRPTMVMVHGGGFKSGDRKSRRWKEFAVSFAEQGWNSASLSYRLVKHDPVIHPVLMKSIPDELTGEDRDQAIAGAGAIETTLHALRFMKIRAGRSCIDPDNIFLIGSSAGGVTVLNTTFMVDELGQGTPPVAGVINYWGSLSDVSTMGQNDTPVFIVHGTKDRTVLYSKSEDLFARGQATNTSVQLHAFEDRGHSWKSINAYQDTINGQPVVDVMIDWIDEVIAGRRPATLKTMN